ncbi:MAG TPA: hypothetical protein VL043_03040 [Protaetiibacter sp.]|nr:hypothetical protein [Protaetiibacter sp.]
MRRRQGRVVAGVAVVAAVGMLLSGCGFVNDVVEGQRITAERLGVDAALRALTSELAELDGVEKAVYGFDAADVSTTPGLEVTLATTEFALGDDVVTRIEKVADGGALDGYPVSVALRSGVLDVQFDTQYGAPWLTEAALDTATRAASVFPGSVPGLLGTSSTDSAVYLSVPGSAEELLSRLEDDAEVASLIAAAHDARQVLSFSADGIEIAGAADGALMQWARERLAVDVPRMLTSVNYDPDVVQPEWMTLTISNYEEVGSVGGNWASASEPGEGEVWAAYVAALRAGPQRTASGDCIDTYLGFGWPGIGNSAGAHAGCGDAPAASAPELERTTVLRDALAAEGIVPEDLGFTLG